MKRIYVIFLFLIVLLVGIYGTGNSINTNAIIDLFDSVHIEKEGRYNIASFNIQTLGKTKINKTIVREYVPKIVRNYDIVVVQELRDNSNFTVEEIKKLLPEYEIVYSPRLGRSNSKEQYLVLYKGSQIGKGETYPDTNDVFEREPYSVYVKIGDYDFSLITVHIKPDDAEREISYLNLVINYFTHRNKDKDFILLGDFNADCSYYNENKKTLTQYSWTIKDSFDTTVGKDSCTYDRIITNLEYASSGVFRFDEEYGLDDGKLISDHYPVWISLI